MIFMDDFEYISSSINEVYKTIGGIRMKYYYVPILSRGFKESKDYIDYDFDNKIEINATINSAQTSDVDLETSTVQLKTNRKICTIQFPLQSIIPYKVQVLDRIYIEFEDGRTANYLIVGIDNGVLLQSIYISVRAFEMETTFTDLEWTDNGRTQSNTDD